MERVVQQVSFQNFSVGRLKKVAAYARVSNGKDAMLHSLSAQVSYYSNYIQQNKGWQFVGVYVDEAITGTKDNRAEFQQMLDLCRKGEIDLIITKSISRFARNTVTLLETIRELKSIGVDVYFEEQNIHTISADGELMLTILASYAQEESLSVSENCKWRIRNNYKQGIPNTFRILGYDFNKGNLKINPQEAKIVSIIFSDFLSGMGRNLIVKKLNSLGVKPKNGGEWDSSKIREILTNEKYVGDMVLQKHFVSSHIDKKKKVNNGDLPKYMIACSHQGIIDREVFNAVQAEIEKRKGIYSSNNNTTSKYKYTGKIICGVCGKHYRRKINNAGTKYEKAVWICDTYNSKGKAFCQSKQIPEAILDTLVGEIEFNNIIVLANNRVCIKSDNQVIEKEWKYK